MHYGCNSDRFRLGCRAKSRDEVGNSGLAPLVPMPDIRIADSLDQNGTAVVDFFGPLNCLGLGWFYGAGAFCAAATDCVIPLGTTFHK